MKTTAISILSLALLVIPGFPAKGETGKNHDFQGNGITIDGEFPGGNLILTETNGEDTFGIAPDLRDTRTPWFYWAFQVKGAAGKTLTFTLKPEHVGVAGPGVSTDGGVTWKWLGAEAVDNGSFQYTFPEGTESVRFSVGMPYQQSDLNRFLEKYRGKPGLEVGTLTTTNKGREVTLIKIGNPDKPNRWAMSVTARNHACEMMGNYIVEGIISTVLADNDAGKWLRDNVDFFIVPFVDTDGVEDGDQGKNRAPHDHNRDYGDSPIYPEVAAIKKQLPEWSNNRPLIAIDLHDPALRNDIHEVLSFLGTKNEAVAKRLDAYTKVLGNESQGSIICNKPYIMKFGSAFNRIDAVPPLHFSGWASTLPNAYLNFTLETPYANASGSEVNADSARELGTDLVYAMKVWLEQEQP